MLQNRAPTVQTDFDISAGRTVNPQDDFFIDARVCHRTEQMGIFRCWPQVQMTIVLAQNTTLSFFYLGGEIKAMCFYCDAL